MGQKKSKASGSMQEVRGRGGLPDIPQDSLLSLMIQYWDASPSRKGKCMEKKCSILVWKYGEENK